MSYETATPPRPTSFAEIVALWGPLDAGHRKNTVERFAANIGLPWPRVYKMVERNFIHWPHWEPVVAAVKRCYGISLTDADWIAMARASRPARLASRREAA